jgi:hypothetical protein
LRERIEKQLNGYCRFIRSQQGGAEYGTKYIAEAQEPYDLSRYLVPSSQSHLEEEQEFYNFPQSPVASSNR